MRAWRLALLALLPFGLAACGGGGGHTDTAASTPAARSWLPVGGNATVALDSTRPFLQFAPGLDASDLKGVSQGRELFVAQWQPAPGPRPLLDGLGPQYIANACTSCHQSSGRVEPFLADGTTSPAVLFRLGNQSSDAHPLYGEQLQTAAVQGAPEGTVTWSRSADGRIAYALHGADLGSYSLSPRLAPQLLGMGLLDLVPEAEILQWEDEADRNHDGISGRAHWITEGGQKQLGRFGWKAVQPSLRGQTASALSQDMGLTNPIYGDNCTDQQPICSQLPNGGTPEVTDDTLDNIRDFLSTLAVPERRIEDAQTFNKGADLFDSVGCAGCHRPTLTTGQSSRFPALSNQTFYPYTDLLLHDMGDNLAVDAQEKGATGREWRTPPLWGIGLVEAAGGHFLHDGRAGSLPEAIGWHGGEAQNTKKRWDALSDSDKQALLKFVRGI